ncbi:tetratricopeptide repeat protein [Beggiatoa alba B18LD]|uniref:Tetratricopeptide repeat protein n=1 Tax=Beggiatoa alba B18LD TaxID=395493 RepID=I3CH43_9GAMM|nr:tetratricopeptide repeat protein [Beggiatoa alba]EIJ42936.1 tetratricopeptide repeat protein [Beggiatoa alba B18LD]
MSIPYQSALIISLLGILSYSTPSLAWQLQFQNADQQAQQAFIAGDYARAAQLFTDDYNRGVAFYRAGDYDNAIKAFASVTHTEQIVSAEYNLGNTYFQRGEYDKALLSYQKVLGADPDNADAKHNLALTYQRLEKPQLPQGSGAEKAEQAQEEGKKRGGELNEGQESQENKADKDASGGKDKEGQGQSGQQGDLSSPQGQNNPPPTEATTDKQRDGGDTPLTQQANAPQPTEPPKNGNSEEPEKTAEQGQETDNPTEQATASSFASQANQRYEAEMLANILLNRVLDNPAQLLQQQFQLDTKKSQLSKPQQTW